MAKAQRQKKITSLPGLPAPPQPQRKFIISEAHINEIIARLDVVTKGGIPIGTVQHVYGIIAMLNQVVAAQSAPPAAANAPQPQPSQPQPPASA